MKFLTTFALSALALASFVQGGATVDFLKSAVPSACQDACAKHIDCVGSCLEELNANLTVSVNTADPNSVSASGDFIGVSSCFCSAEAINYSVGCLTCANKELCLESKPITVHDYQDVCNRGPIALAELYGRYHDGACPSNGSGATAGLGHGEQGEPKKPCNHTGSKHCAHCNGHQ